MSEHLKELISLFKLDKISFGSANRKTLDNWIKKVQLQRRRQILFEANCEKGKIKSRVALCKKEGRPSFNIQLSTLSTKKLRAIIKQFLSALGLDNYSSLQSKSDTELQKLSKKRGWEKLLFMSDMNIDELGDDKEGGMLGIPRRQGHGRKFRHSLLDERLPSVEPGQAAQPVAMNPNKLFPKGRHELGGSPKQKKRKRKVGDLQKKRSRYMKQKDMAELETEQFEKIPSPPPSRVEQQIVPIRTPSPSPKPARRRSRSRSRSLAKVDSPVFLASPLRRENLRHMYSHSESPVPVRIPPKIATLGAAANQPMPNVDFNISDQVGVDVANLPGPMPPIEPPRDSYFPKKPTPTKKEKKQIDELKEKLKELHPKMPKVPAVVPSNMERMCYREKEFSDECSDCTPLDLSNIKMPRDARKELKYLAVQRKLVCERTALLKCKFDELRYQRMCWDLFSENASGDFFARIAKDKFKAFDKCTPSTAFDTNEISRLRGILACYSDSQKVCKGYHQVRAKEHNDTSKLGPGFTLPTMRYDQLAKEQKVDKGDRFLGTALKNRDPEPDTGYKRVCEKEDVASPTVPPLTEEQKQPLNSLTAPGVLVQKPVLPIGTSQQGSGPSGQNPAQQRVPPVAQAHPTGQPTVPPAQSPNVPFGPFTGGGQVGGNPQKIVESVPSIGEFQTAPTEIPPSMSVDPGLQQQWLDAGVKNIKVQIQAMRLEGKSEQEIVDWFNSLPGETEKLTVEKLALEFPKGTTVQDPSAFHFRQTPSGRFTNSPRGLKSVVSIPLPTPHAHVHSEETPSGKLIRATQTPTVQQLPSDVTSAHPTEWTTASFPAGSLATEIPQPEQDSWDQIMKEFRADHNLPDSPAKHVSFFGTPVQTSPTQDIEARGFTVPKKKKPKPEPKRKSLVGELFKQQKKKKRSRSNTPKKKKKPKTPQKKRSKSVTIPHRLPKEGSGWDDDDYLAGMVASEKTEPKTEPRPVARLIRQPSIRRKRYFR